MKRKFLEDLGLEKEAIDKIMAENGNDVNAVRAEFESVKQQLEAANSQIQERDKQLEALKKSTGDNEAMQKQITDLQTENKAAKEKYESEMKDLKLSTAVKLSVAGIAHDTDIVSGLLDKSKLILSDDGKVSGLEEQINALKKEKSFLFKEGEKTGAKSDAGTKKTGYTPTTGRTNDGGIAKILADSMNKETQPADNPYAKSWN